MTVKCTNCNKEQEYNEEKRFCEMCGTKLPQTKQCIKCNKELPIEANFCSFCGTNQNEAINNSQNAGFHMGNDNIVEKLNVSVVGKKEETHIAGNATIVKNEDETKHVKVCHICGSHKTVLEGHDCPECKKFTCNSCFNKEYKMCNGCATNKISENEKAYKEKLVQFLEDGIIDRNERKELDDLKQKYMISDETSLRLENSLKKNINIETLLTTIEKSNLENSYEIFYDEGDVVEAYNLLKPLYDKYPNEEKVLEIFLPVLLKKDINEAKTVVTNSSIDSFSVFLLKTQIALEENRLDDAERNLLQAKKYANNNVVKYFEVLLNTKIAEQTEDDKFLNNAQEIIDTMTDTQNKLEVSYKIKASIEYKNATEEKFNYLTTKDISEQNIYKSLVFSSIEVTVGVGQNYEKIQDAINDVHAGCTIHVSPGKYKENLVINKAVSIIGITDDIREKSSKELVFVVSDKEIGCRIESNAKIEGIVFTNNDDILFDKMVEYNSSYEMSEKHSAKSCIYINADSHLTNIVVLDSFVNAVTVSSCNPFLNEMKIFSCLCGIYIKRESTGTYENCEISNTKFVGIYVNEKSNPQVIGCNIHDITNGNGIAIEGESTGTWENCEISNTKLVGIRINEKSNPQVIGCNIHNILDHPGITIGGESIGTYENCEISNTKFVGIYVNEKSNPQVIGCNIHDIPDGDGIAIDEKSTGTYKNCEISNTEATGIYVNERSNPQVIGCKIHNIPDDRGISIEGESTGTYENCEIYNTKHSSIFVDEKSNPQVIGCKLHDDGHGIAIEGESTGTYENCEISNTKFAGILVKEKSNPQVIGCNIHDIPVQIGIVIKGESTGIYENCEISNITTGILVKEKSNPQVKGCNIYDIPNGSGIVIYEKSTGTYENCEISNTKFAGILVEEDSNPQVKGCNIHDITNGNGIAIEGESTGTYENCEISNTESAGILVKEKSNPQVKGCNIHDISDGNGIAIYEKTTGIYENCEISNTAIGIHVLEKSNPQVIGCKIHDISDSFGILIDDKAKGIYRECNFYNVRWPISASRRAKIINCVKC